VMYSHAPGISGRFSFFSFRFATLSSTSEKEWFGISIAQTGETKKIQWQEMYW
jgi:hypothetical protein